MKMIIIFAICSLINVMLNTIKTIIMYKNEKISSSVINAITYGFYTVVVVLMAGDMALWVKVVLTAATNFFGVYLSMMLLEKLRKDKLWKVEATIPTKYAEAVHFDLKTVPHSFIKISEKHTLFNFYCATQKESTKVKAIINQYDAKYFVSESKNL